MIKNKVSLERRFDDRQHQIIVDADSSLDECILVAEGWLNYLIQRKKDSEKKPEDVVEQEKPAEASKE